VLLEAFLGHGPERVEADVERHARDVEASKQLGREVQAGGRRGGGAGVPRVDGLVARGIGEGLGDVGRQRCLTYPINYLIYRLISLMFKTYNSSKLAYIICIVAFI